MKALIPTVLAALCWALPHPASAQPSSQPDVSVAYSNLQPSDDDLSFPTGFMASVSKHVASGLSVVGDVGGNYMSESGETLRLYTFQGGARYSPNPAARVRPYAQMLAGFVNVSCSCGDDMIFRPMVEPGGGIEVQLQRNLAFRAGVGVPVFFVDSERPWGVRTTVGVTFTPGRR